MDNALVLNDVSLRIGNRPVFSNLNLEIKRGEIAAICGLMSGNLREFENIIAHNTEESYSVSGSIILDAAEKERLTDDDLRLLRMVNIGILPLISSVGTIRMTVESYITLPLRESIKKSRREIILDAKRIMGLLGVKNAEEIMRKKMTCLSPLELRAVLYATALSTDPAIALFYADTDMTFSEKEIFYPLLIKVCKIKNIALILLTSDISLANKYGESVYISEKDHIVLKENASEPFLTFLADASSCTPLLKEDHAQEELIRISHMKATRKDEKISFSLNKKEVLSFSCKHDNLLFTGKKKPFHGNIYAGNLPLKNNKTFQKKIMHISETFPIISGETVQDILKAFCARPTLRDDMGRILNFLPIPEYCLEKPAMPETLFDTLFLGLLCAAMSESKLILLSDIDRILSPADKYFLLTLLAAICERTNSGAIVFSQSNTVHQILSSKTFVLQEEQTTKERTHAYADET